jgi:hypothetical protein
MDFRARRHTHRVLADTLRALRQPPSVLKGSRARSIRLAVRIVDPDAGAAGTPTSVAFAGAALSARRGRVVQVAAVGPLSNEPIFRWAGRTRLAPAYRRLTTISDRTPGPLTRTAMPFGHGRSGAWIRGRAGR